MKNKCFVYVVVVCFSLMVEMRAAQLTMLAQSSRQQGVPEAGGQKVDEPVRAKQQDGARVIFAPQSAALVVPESNAVELAKKEHDAYFLQARGMLIKILEHYAISFSDAASEDPALGKAMFDLVKIVSSNNYHNQFVTLIKIVDRAIVKIYESRTKMPVRMRAQIGDDDIRDQRATVASAIAQELCNSLGGGTVDPAQVDARAMFSTTVFDTRVICLKGIMMQRQLQQIAVPQAYQAQAMRDQMPRDVQMIFEPASVAPAPLRSAQQSLSMSPAAAGGSAGMLLPVAATPVPAGAGQQHVQQQVAHLPLQVESSEKEKVAGQHLELHLRRPAAAPAVKHDAYKMLKKEVVAAVMQKATEFAKSSVAGEAEAAVALNGLIGETMHERNFLWINSIIKNVNIRIKAILDNKIGEVDAIDPEFLVLRANQVQVIKGELSKCFGDGELKMYERGASACFGEVIFDVCLKHALKARPVIKKPTFTIPSIRWGNVLKAMAVVLTINYNRESLKSAAIKYGKPLAFGALRYGYRFGAYLMGPK